MTDSGTSALALAIQLSSKGDGRPVALPAYACYDIATATVAAGASFVLYDLDPHTLGPSEESLGRAVQAGADRIVIVHLYGLPVDMRMVNRLATAAGVLIIDDAAQGAGASVDGMPVGGLGSMGVLSFGRGKGVTGGRGGALLLHEDLSAAEERARSVLNPDVGSAVRDLGTGFAQWLFGRPSLYAIPASIPGLGLGETVYREPHTATAPPAFSVGVLQETLPLAEAESARRRTHAIRLKSSATGANLVAPAEPQGSLPGYLRLALVASEEKARAARTGSARRLGVMPGYPTALSNLERFGAQRLNRGDAFEGAELLATRLVTLPVHGAMTERDLSRVEEWCAEPG